MNKRGFATAILLAAGGSIRLGRPKQLLLWNESTLLGTAIDQLTTAGCERLIIVLGAHDLEVRQHCVAPSGVHLDIVTNTDWSKGQATSLKTGIEYGLGLKHIGATIVALCDQPLIASSHYQSLLACVCDQGYFAAATKYPEGFGVPACFSVPAMRSLSIATGDVGAKKWLRTQPANSIGGVTCPAAELDIDTELEYRERLNRE